MELSDRLEQYNLECEQIITAFREKLEPQEPSGLIYQYTNDAGLRGILDSGKIWLTNIFKLNDPSELTHGFSHATEILKNESANSPIQREFARRVEEFYRSGDIQKVVRIFSASFSKDGDDLGQWRAYADNGRGYALGFKPERIVEAFQTGGTERQNKRTHPITYCDSQLTELQRKLSDAADSHLLALSNAALHDSIRNECLNRLCGWFSQNAMLASLYFKHVAYRNEKEFRLIHIDPRNELQVKYNLRPYSQIEYVEFDWKSVAPDALQGVRVGPDAGNQARAIQFARDCLTAFRYSDVTVKPSEIPFRAT
jgi:Protein of unknown function (DUF2971)